MKLDMIYIKFTEKLQKTSWVVFCVGSPLYTKIFKNLKPKNLKNPKT